MGKIELGFLVSLIILLGICDATRNSSLGCVERERRVLLSFRETLSDPSNRLSSWNSINKDCCSWEGVTCRKTTGHVVSLDLTRGDKPDADTLQAERVDDSWLLELKHLTYLDLSCIDFSSNKFPAYLGSLKQLQYLNLSGTYFSGVVPQNLGNLSSLHTLDLGGLTVEDLTWATRLSSLEHLDMSDVDLSMESHVFEVLNTIPSLQFLSLSWGGLNNTHLPNSCLNSTLLANIQHLDLSRNSFQGEYPCFLSNMTSLNFLDLSDNMFHHSGTHLLGLKNLTHLNLADNWIHDKVYWDSQFLENKCHLQSLDLNGIGIYGDISRVFTNLSTHKLQSLRLGFNNFHGELPPELGELQHLMNLDLSNNFIHGRIPTSLGKLVALTNLDISSNNFSGPLPSSLENLKSLRLLILSGNKLSGEIPISLGELSHLEYIDISFNFFKTILVEAHFTKLSNLQHLYAASNMIRFGVGYDWVPPFQVTYLNFRSSMLGGQFPQWLQTQKALERLYLSNCSITGTLPPWLHSMSSLIELDLSHNHISGAIPELSSSNMTFLDLSDNMITHLPTNIGLMIPHLEYLILARNLINASIPDSLCRMKNLTILDLSKNRFSGNLPSCWSSFNELMIASFSSNELTGVIPNSIGRALSLIRLRLDGNTLTGQLPYTLQNCKGLDLLDVGGNNLSGKLPHWIGKHMLHLRFLRLRNNDFSGTIPYELCRLSKLQVMDLANNSLTGNIQYCFANFSGMMINHEESGTLFSFEDGITFSEGLIQVIKGVELEYTTNFFYVVNLDLSSNHLVGEIPWQLTNLSGLLGLNLSHNHLGGQIPAKIGDMKSLESLDLSNNNLLGIIPHSLSSLSFLSRLNLSNNNLSGQIPAGRQLQTLDDPSIYQGNPLLCGAPLQRKCDKAGIAPDVENHEAKDEDRVDRIWFYGVVIAGFATGFWAVIGGMVVKTKWRQAYFRYIEVAMAKMLNY